ncbi:MAG: hypothetical protein JO266_15800 [Acidobacteria bacterium]|nr:hypothetical protein [Acidobacteriota bacterium]
MVQRQLTASTADHTSTAAVISGHGNDLAFARTRTVFRQEIDNRNVQQITTDGWAGEEDWFTDGLHLLVLTGTTCEHYSVFLRRNTIRLACILGSSLASRVSDDVCS